jgi:hypothetical protein
MLGQLQAEYGYLPEGALRILSEQTGRPSVGIAAPMVLLELIGGGTVSFCSRRGCTQHLLDVTSV